MHPVPFIAATAEEAVSQIRARLGPEAIVLNVRPLPASGLARLWQKPMIEVLAYRPETKPNVPPEISETLAEVQEQLKEIKQQVGNYSRAESKLPSSGEKSLSEDLSANLDSAHGGWRVGAILQRTGLLPLHAQSILDRLRAEHGETAPASFDIELDLTRQLLKKLWRQPPPVAERTLHVLIGPAGSGKTTSLSKWLTRTTLVEGRLARVWRLDGAVANMAESLSVYCEILGVPLERSYQSGTVMSEDIGFIDVPGVNWRNPAAIEELGKFLKQCGSPQIHLTLNAAYETSTLLAQVRAFSVLPVEDIVLTHLDEESHWGKIWNLVLGTNFSVRHLSTGQNIPGDFHDASAEAILSRQFPNK